MQMFFQGLFAIAFLRVINALPVVDDQESSVSPQIYARDAQSNRVIAVDQAGGPHGDDNWDDGSVLGNSFLRIGEISMWCDQKNNGELQALAFSFRDNAKPKDGWYAYKLHGTNASPAQTQTWTLDADEYVTTINAYTYKAKGHTRIGTLVFNTNKHAGFAICGPKTGTKVMLGNPDWALLYTSGTSGRVIDFMQAHWISALNF